VTVTGTGTYATHSTTITLTVNPSGGGSVVVNGGFETGDFTGWTRSGVLLPTIQSGGAHTGTYSAKLGSSVPFNGDSILQQTITVPSAGGTLVFWYNPHCPDTIQYDQQQAQIRSTGGSILATVMNVCSNSAVWTQVSYSLNPWAGQTVVLWFNAHDDNYPSDPTYMLLDDVAVNAAAPNVLVNGGFETGTFSGWTTGGALLPTIQSGGAHTGTYAAKLGSSTPYNGDSWMQQTVTVPSAGGTLTFWYQPHCTDTITYDWERMEIRNTSGTTLATVLNVCSNSGVWTLVTYSMNTWAGQTVVLWFNNHDDNYPSDPTYTLVDDVALQ